ncbi:starch-binding protein [Flammeovirga agarivorans]|uniref:Starch-binding protein n=1 Tax=Flammeovirga agarivorans TaxID=2726742 RepID=A0A7X8SJJ6_9BACT|nr:starch-binding protein [Flammeovirga agarivorans]NLR91298.1 starch-binding protein [Flammeovirga agarivorans]
MKKLTKGVIGMLCYLLCLSYQSAFAQQADGTEVYLQGFHWESADAEKMDWWANLDSKVTAIKAADIDGVWLPPSSDAADRAGYLPRKWYDLNSNYGTQQELIDLIAHLKSEGIISIADIVINHRVGCTNWADFCEPALGCNAITQDDEVNEQFPGQGCGDWDTGTPYSAARDINHNDNETRQAIKDWMNWLISDIGYAGWRYDFVHGFGAGFFAEYNNATSPYISIGENWTGDTQAIVNWMDGAQGTSTAFDFPLKFALHEAMTGNYGALNNGGKMPGIAGVWPQNSVTFLENHDTEPVRQGDHPGSAFPNDPSSNSQILQGYAYILTHAGSPMVFYSHLFEYGLYDDIANMVALRKANGIHSTSAVSIQQADGSGYAAIIDDKVAVRLGNTNWSPSGSGWVLQSDGLNYAIWDKGTGVNQSPIVTINPQVSQSDNPLEVELTVSDDRDTQLDIFYTLDGTTPSVSSTKYNGTFMLASTTTVKAISFDADGRSGYDEKKFYIGEQLPEMSVYVRKPSGWGTLYAHHWAAVPAGVVDDTEWPGVTMQKVDGTASWYKITLAGAESASFVFHDYNANQDEDVTISGSSWYDGGVVTSTCPGDCPPIDEDVTVEVNIAPSSTSFDNQIEVALSGTQGATIHYTLDGTTPSSSSESYTSPIIITETTTVKALAVFGENTSEVITATYSKNDIIEDDKPIAKTSGFTWDNATVYFTMTDRFYDGDPSNNNSYGRGMNGNGQGYTDDSSAGEFHGGDLKGMTAKLKEGYFESIGVNAIWITSPVEQMHGWVGGSSDGSFRHYGYHGYYAMDWTEIDQNMGTEADFQEFIDEAHSRGIRIVVDVVMNHTGYVTMHDMEQYNYGTVDPAWRSWQPSGSESWHSYHEKFINYANGGTWMTNYWGSDWMRHPDIEGYDDCSSGGGIDNCVGFLPDLKTEDIAPVNIPPILVNKWSQEGTLSQKTAELDAFFNKTGLPRVVSNYMIFWLTDWVRKYGIDGFRIDTAKHVELERWSRLKQYAIAALKDWKAEHPDQAMDDEEFWMTAEVWGHGKNKSEYHTVGEFNSVINFNLKNDARVKSRDASSLESLFTEYATINDDPTWNSLSYLSSHDVAPLFDRNSLKAAAPAFLLLPGGIQIFYGDESGRPSGNWADEEQNTRSDMNWGNFDNAQHEVWKKLGTFRRDHPAVGAGTHQKIGDAPYTFVRDYNNQEKSIADRVIVAVGASGNVEFNVGDYYMEGDTIVDHYTGATDVVTNGKVQFTADAEGIILLYNRNYVFVSRPVVSISPDSQYDPNSITVSISAVDADDPNPTIYYTTEENADASNYLNWNVYTASFDLTASATVTAVAVNAEGRSGSASKKYAIGQIDPINIYYYKPAAWGNANMHHFDATPVGVTEDTVWPGVSMTPIGEGWYHATVTALSTGIVFNDNGGAQSDDLSRDRDGWYKDGQWTDTCPGNCPGEQPPTVAISPNGGNYPEGNVSVGISATNDGIIYYTIDGTTPTTSSSVYQGSIAITGSELDEVTVKAIAVNEVGTSSEVEATFTFRQISTHIVYVKNYTHIYYWDVEEGGVVTEANPVQWPGIALEDASELGSGWKKITIEGGTCSNVIFNNSGSAQTGDLSTCGNEGKGYDNGVWVEIGEDTTSPTLGMTPSSSFSGQGVVTITASDNRTTSPQIFYTIDGSSPTTSSLSGNGTVEITLTEVGQHTVKAFAQDDAGNVSEVQSTTYTVEEVIGGFKVYFQGAENPLIHYWNAEPVGSIASTTWPGVSLTAGTDGWWYFEFPSNVTSVNLLFHNNSGYKSADLSRDKDGWYRNGQWYDVKPVDPTGLTVHFKSGWGDATKIHYWNASNGDASAWPGENMISEGNGWYRYTIEGATSANLLFHNGSGSQTSDLFRDIEGWYKDGVWYNTNPEDSGARLITALPLEEEIELNVFPTMVDHELSVKLKLPFAQDIALFMYDLNGHLLEKKEYNNVAQGAHVFQLDMKDFTTGVYIIRMSLNDELITKKIIKK